MDLSDRPDPQRPPKIPPGGSVVDQTTSAGITSKTTPGAATEKQTRPGDNGNVASYTGEFSHKGRRRDEDLWIAAQSGKKPGQI